MIRNHPARVLCGELRRRGWYMNLHILLGLERGVRQSPKLLPLSSMLRSKTIFPKALSFGFVIKKN